jgi:hypothetical protein
MLYRYFDKFVLLVHLYKYQYLIYRFFFINKNLTYKDMFLVDEQHLDHYSIEYVFGQYPNRDLLLQNHQAAIVPN